MHHRCTGNNSYLAHLGEVRNQFVGHAIGEILLFWIMRKVFQRNYSQRGDLRWRLWPRGTPGTEAPNAYCNDDPEDYNCGCQDGAPKTDLRSTRRTFGNNFFLDLIARNHRHEQPITTARKCLD